MIIGIDASRANQREKTGTEWYSWHLIRQLVPLLPGHTIRLYTREPLMEDLGVNAYANDANVEERVLSWRLGLMWTHLRLSWEMLWHKPDVLLILADTVPLVHPKQTFTTIHDIAFERMPELYGQGSVQRRMGWAKPLVSLLIRIFTLGRYGASELDYHRWSVRHALRACQKIFSVSKFTKQELIDVLKADPENILVTYQGIPQPADIEQQMTAAPTDLVAQLKLPKQYFIFNGRLERKKNLINLLEGFRLFREAGGTVELVLVGSPGVGWEQVQQWLNDHSDIQSAVIILPWQPTSHLWRLMRGALAYVFVSPYEGFGRPPLEAYSCGVPVIAARSSSLPEVLGDCPFYVDPHDSESIGTAMGVVAKSPDAARASVSCGQQNVKRFTWETTAKMTAETILLLDSTL